MVPLKFGGLFGDHKIVSDNWLERIFMEHVLSEEDFRLKIDMRSILSTRITIGTINEMIKNFKTKIFGTILIFFPNLYLRVLTGTI